MTASPTRSTAAPGIDVVIADFKDIIVDATAANANGSCERVVRRPARRRDGRDERKADRDDDRFEKEGERRASAAAVAGDR